MTKFETTGFGMRQVFRIGSRHISGFVIRASFVIRHSDFGWVPSFVNVISQLMPLFQYRALQADGVTAEGQLEAAGRQEAFRQMEGLGLRPIKLLEKAGVEAQKASGLPAMPASLSLKRWRTRCPSHRTPFPGCM